MIKFCKPLLYKVPKTQVNPKNMGYVLKNGIINFGSEESAQLYAKNRTISALKAKEPFERAVLVNKKQILGEFSGNRDSVMIKHELLRPHTSLVHGHPNATPISLIDYFSCKQNPKIDAVHAYNIKGEISSLYKTEEKNMTSKSIEEILEALRWKNDEYVTNKYNSMFVSYVEKFLLMFKHIFNKITHKSDKTIDEQYIQLLVQRQISNEGRLKIHRFWKRNAKKMGVEYKTNYSEYLDNQDTLWMKILSVIKNSSNLKNNKNK